MGFVVRSLSEKYETSRSLSLTHTLSLSLARALSVAVRIDQSGIPHARCCSSRRFDAPRCRANMAHIRQSRPYSGLGCQVNILKTFQGDPSSRGRGWAVQHHPFRCGPISRSSFGGSILHTVSGGVVAREATPVILHRTVSKDGARRARNLLFLSSCLSLSPPSPTLDAPQRQISSQCPTDATARR